MSSSGPEASHLAVGPVSLTVADVAGARAFYERAIGLRTLAVDGGRATLGAAGGAPLVELVGDPDAPPRPPRTTGLYHLAILVPGRAELARALQRVIGAGWRFTGASDHLVSEALYLDDPEGNGIELYRDRPRQEWTYEPGGELRMATDPLDLDGLMRELPGDADPGMPAGTTLGHVHLNVADLDATEAFYSGLLGLDVTVRSYPSARFLSRGGYHHHLGTNVWAGAGAPPPPPGSRGLRHFGFRLGGAGEPAAVRERLEGAGVEVRENGGDGLLAADPSGNAVLLTAA